MKKLQYFAAFRCIRTIVATDKLVVYETAICHCYGAPRPGPYPRAKWQARAEYQRVQQIAIKAEVVRYGAIIEGAWQGRDKIDSTRGPTLEKTSSGNFHYDLHHQRLG